MAQSEVCHNALLFPSLDLSARTAWSLACVQLGVAPLELVARKQTWRCVSISLPASAGSAPVGEDGRLSFISASNLINFFRCLRWLGSEVKVLTQLYTCLKAGPPLIWVFGHFWLFLHHGIDKVERHLLWKFLKKIQRICWSNVSPKLLACIRFLYKVAHKIGPLRKFNRAREIEFNFIIAWTIFMKLGTLVHHVHGYKTCLRLFNFRPGF